MSFRSVRAFALCAIGSAFAGGCAADDRSISFDRFVEATTATTGGCSVDPSIMNSLSRGVFDAEVASFFTGGGYVASFIVTNNLLLRTDETVDTQSYTINAYDVDLEVTGPATAAIPAGQRKFTVVSGSVRVRPQMSAGGSVSVLSPTVVQSLIGLGANLDASGGSEVNAKIRAHVSRGGEHHVTAYFNLPVDICWGCLLQVPADTPCASVAATARMSGNGCNYAQDQAVTCCTTNGAEACGASIPQTSP